MKTHPERLPTSFAELVRVFPPQAIHDEIGYANTLEMIDRLTSLPRMSAAQTEYLQTLTILFEAYENEHERIDASRLTPLRVLHFLVESNDMSAGDLGRLLGNRALGAKILSGSRELSKAHIRKLAERFKVDAGLFL